MIELKISVDRPDELRDIFAGFGRMVEHCVAAVGPCCEPIAVATEEPDEAVLVADLEKMRSVLDKAGEPEYEDAPEVVEAEKPKRTRKKKAASTVVDTPVEDTPAKEPVAEVVEEKAAEEPTATEAKGELTIQDVREVLILARERAGADPVRHMLADMGGMLKDIPENKWPEVIKKAKALV